MKTGHMEHKLILRGNLRRSIKLLLQTIATCDDVEWNSIVYTTTALCHGL